MSWLSGPSGPPVRPIRPTKVTAGLANRGDEMVIVLIIETPDYAGPITVAVPDDQARKLRDQLTATLGEST